MSNAVIVRYELDPDRLDEHVRLIESVFAHLEATKPDGVHYGVMRSDDGTSFTHIGIYDSEEAREAASGNEAFQASWPRSATVASCPPTRCRRRSSPATGFSTPEISVARRWRRR